MKQKASHQAHKENAKFRPDLFFSLCLAVIATDSMSILSDSLERAVERAGERPLTRQMREAQKIANEAPGMLINGRNEHIPPAIRPLAPGHLLDGEAMRGEQARGAGR